MKIIIDKNALEVVSEASFRSAHPNISFPLVLSEAALEGTDYLLKELPPQPTLLPYQRVELVVTEVGEDVDLSYNIVTELPSIDILLKNYEEAIDNLIDSKAKEYNYDNVYTMVSYKGDPNPKFDREARSMFLWRSQVWTTVNTLLQNFLSSLGENGLDTEEIPSIGNILAALPVFVLLEE